MDLIATLWPAGIRSAVVTPSATTSPGGRLDRAINTPSSGCRRITGAGAMVVLPEVGLSPRKRGERKTRLCLPAGVLAGLVHLHLGVGHHQPALVRQGDELEAHVDGAHGAIGAGAVDARVEATLAAFLDDLLVDLEDLRLGPIELRLETI